jgi:hypothetical protein
MKLGGIQKKFKAIILIIFLVVILGATIVLGQQASNMFAKASACPAKNVSAVQVTANSAVITWDSDDPTQGIVQYGTSAAALTTTSAIRAPETAQATKHNVPLTLLAPQTTYYYLLKIGDKTCDSTGNPCDGDCVPWSFQTTSAAGAQATLPPNTPTPRTASASATPRVTSRPAGASSATSSAGTQTATSSGQMSEFCQKVKKNVGASTLDAAMWMTLKQYDMDGNGVVNGLDVIKCQQSGR